MKCQSKAEEALKSQWNMLQGEIQGMLQVKADCEIKIATLTDISQKVMSEISRLESLRLKASTDRKP